MYRDIYKAAQEQLDDEQEHKDEIYGPADEPITGCEDFIEA